MSKKILYITEALGGGVRRNLLDLIEHFNGKHEVHIIYSKKRADDTFFSEYPKLLKKDVRFYEVPEFSREISIWNDTKSFCKILKLIYQISPDIIHCHSSKAGVLGRLATLFWINREKKVYYTPHAYYSQNPNLSLKKRNFFNFIEKKLSKITDYTVNVSEAENQFALDNHIVKKENTVIIPNGVNDVNKNIMTKNTFIVGTVARAEEQKNPYLFYKIAKKVIEKNPNIEFVYIGDGPLLENMSKKVEMDNLSGKVKFVGFSSKPLDFMKEFDIYLSTSLYEGLPYAVIEAMSLKKPLLLTNVTGNNELVTNNLNGNLFELGDDTQATNIILSLYNDKINMRKYSQNSYRIFKEKYSLDIMLNNYESLYFNKI